MSDISPESQAPPAEPTNWFEVVVAKTGTEPPGPEREVDSLRRAVRRTAIVLLVLVVGFGAYYYWDRYVHIGDVSPLDMSISELEAAVLRNPDDPDLRLSLAQVYMGRSRFGDAQRQAEQVLAAYPDNESAMLILGIAYESTDQPVAAIAVLEEFIGRRKGTEMAHVDTILEAAYFYVGRSYLSTNQVEAAAMSLDAAIAIAPGDADALYLSGKAHHLLGSYDVALARFERAVTFVPDFVEAYDSMADTYEVLGDESGSAYARAMRSYASRQYDTALPVLLGVTDSDPDFAPAFMGLGLVYEQLGRLDDAQRVLQRALELRPDDVSTRQTLGRVQQAMGQ